MLRKARSPGCQSMWRWTLSPGDGSSGTDINNYDFFAAVPCYFVTSTRAFIAILVEICLSLSSIHLRTSKNICLRLCYAKDYHHVFLADGRTLRWCPCITPSRRRRTRRALSGSPSLTTRLTRRRLPISVRVTIYLCPSQYCCLIKIESYYIRLLREFYMYIFTKPVSKLIKNIWLAFANLVLGKTLNPVTV